MIKQWMYKRKQKREQEYEKQKDYVAKREDEAKERIKKSNNEIMSKWCPIIDRHCIGHDCVHFKSAKFFYHDGGLFEGVYGNGAKCNLWGNYGCLWT
jgi:hypothetical protein